MGISTSWIRNVLVLSTQIYNVYPNNFQNVIEYYATNELLWSYFWNLNAHYSKTINLLSAGLRNFLLR